MSPVCAICGASSEAIRVFSRDDSIGLHRCTRCACEFLWPQPSAERLAVEYREYYQRRGTSMTRPKVDFFARLLAETRLPLNGLSVLEIGAGEGDCVAALNRHWPDARVTALESHPDSAALYRDLRCERVQDSVESWLARGERRAFDVILLFDLLEHLRDPSGALQALAGRNLAPGGTSVATFPNAGSVSRRALGRLWPQYKLEHLFYFSRASVGRIASDSNLETIALRPLAKRLPLEYLLAVGGDFGPRATQAAARLIRRMTPRSAGRATPPLRFGEWLWIARKVQAYPGASTVG